MPIGKKDNVLVIHVGDIGSRLIFEGEWNPKGHFILKPTDQDDALMQVSAVARLHSQLLFYALHLGKKAPRGKKQTKTSLAPIADECEPVRSIRQNLSEIIGHLVKATKTFLHWALHWLSKGANNVYGWLCLLWHARKTWDFKAFRKEQ